jgi:formamidopyrimidine-DNA glycosylase
VPELPEIQALSERLHDLLAGKTLQGLTVLQFSAAKSFDPPIDSTVGTVLAGVSWRAKYLGFDFGGPRLLIHLSQGGRIDVERPPKRTRPKGAVARLTFDDVSLLVKEYGTQRKAGLWMVAPGEHGPMSVLGPDPFEADFERLLLTATDRRRLHTFLRDQRTVSGIGRGYVDDILHRARLSPYANLTQLSGEQRRELVSTIRDVLTEALDSERKRTGGLPPKLGDRFIVHNRHGGPCPRCGDEMKRVSYEDYEMTYCPTCQTGGKVLADRRLSRLLK